MLKPVIFSAPMVRAILAGKKTQTRRVISPQPEWKVRRFRTTTVNEAWRSGFVDVESPYGDRGDFLYVRETYRRNPRKKKEIFYRATEPDDSARWYPSIYMPRSCSRILLEIKDVRIERLQEISKFDAEAEGVVPQIHDPNDDLLAHEQAFASLWESINGHRGYGWHSNPWVWVIEFKVARRNLKPDELNRMIKRESRFK